MYRRVFSTTTSKIINNDLPICKNCIFFITNNKDVFLEAVQNTEPDSKMKFDKCMNFGTKNVVSGNISYYNAATCRNSDELCGYEGKYYREPTVPL